jgi:protein TonB
MPSLAPLPPVPLAAPTPRVATATPAPASAPVAALGQAAGSPQGKGAITMNVSDFPFAWYLQTVQRKINEKWAPPARGSESRAVIVFEIGRNGDVRRPAVEDSSGDAGYDQAALRAVADANPFPPLPADYRPQVLKIYLGFDFAANRS